MTILYLYDMIIWKKLYQYQHYFIKKNNIGSRPLSNIHLLSGMGLIKNVTELNKKGNVFLCVSSRVPKGVLDWILHQWLLLRPFAFPNLDRGQRPNMANDLMVDLDSRWRLKNPDVWWCLSQNGTWGSSSHNQCVKCESSCPHAWQEVVSLPLAFQ